VFASRGAANVPIANSFGACLAAAHSPGSVDPYTIAITHAPAAKAVVARAPGSALLPAGSTVAAPEITGPPANGAGTLCAGNSGAAGTAGTGASNVIADLNPALPPGGTPTIAILMGYSNNQGNY
jgi:hypothetical protein